MTALDSRAKVECDLIDRALAEMREARDIHQRWADYFKGCSNPNCAYCQREAELVGGCETHEEWVRRYDGWIAVIVFTGVLVEMPRWRSWLWGRLPSRWPFHGLIERLGPEVPRG